MNLIHITITGPIGCGKSAVAEEIAIALRAIGLDVQFANPTAAAAERAMVDYGEELERHRSKIQVVIAERLASTQCLASMGSGHGEV